MIMMKVEDKCFCGRQSHHDAIRIGASLLSLLLPPRGSFFGARNVQHRADMPTVLYTNSCTTRYCTVPPTTRADNAGAVLLTPGVSAHAAYALMFAVAYGIADQSCMRCCAVFKAAPVMGPDIQYIVRHILRPSWRGEISLRLGRLPSKPPRSVSFVTVACLQDARRPRPSGFRRPCSSLDAWQ